jgi:hypothetical protein
VREILALFGTIEYEENYDYKTARRYKSDRLYADWRTEPIVDSVDETSGEDQQPS